MDGWRRTACNRDCPDACVLLVDVRDGQATGLRGDPADPITRGFLCERTGRFLARQNDPQRITTPLVRAGLLQRWRAAGDGRTSDPVTAAALLRPGAARLAEPLLPASWEEALPLAAAALGAVRAESGPAAVLHYRSGGSLGLLKLLADKLFEAWGPVTIKHGDICSGAGEAAQEQDFGVSESHDIFDLHESRTILLWGKNVHVSNVHLLPVLREARRRGARIVGIDPVATRAAELCELFVQPRPGGDFALAAAIALRLLQEGSADPRAAERSENLAEFETLVHQRSFEEWCAAADVPVAEAAHIAELYGHGKPGAILVGWGLARRRHGGATVRALDALGLLSGNLGVPGGGVSYSYARRKPFDTSFVRGEDAAPRTLSEARLGAEILAARDPPIRAIWVTAGNPIAMLPDSAVVRRAFEASAFNVVVDTHPGDTTDASDLVLPTLTLLEDTDLLGSYGHHWLRVSEAAVEAPGAGAGPRHELLVLQGLAEYLGPAVAAAVAGTPDDWRRRLLAPLAAAGITLESLQAGSRRNPRAPRLLFADGRFPTPSGRARLLREAPPDPPPLPPGRPFTLLATSTPKAQSSQWSVERVGPAEAHVHPESARDCADGSVARLCSANGELLVRVRHDATLRRDVIWMAKGGSLRDGRCSNLLVSARETDIGAGAAYYDEPVALQPLSGPDTRPD